MLSIQGKEYKICSIFSEPKLEHIMLDNYQEIFGGKTILISDKTKIQNLTNLKNITDAFIITLPNPPKLFIVNYELSTLVRSRCYSNKISEFIQNLNDENNKEILAALFVEFINKNKLKYLIYRNIGKIDIHNFITDLINTSMELLVITNDITKDIDYDFKLISYGKKHIIKFNVYENLSDKLDKIIIFPHLAIKSPRENMKNIKLKTQNTKFITPRYLYNLTLLETLVEMGGKGETRKILNKLYEKMKYRFTYDDLEILPGYREKRWENHTRYARLNLINSGLMINNSDRGIWEISKKGIDYVKKGEHYNIAF